MTTGWACTRCQDEPFQCMITVHRLLPPTAQALRTVIAATAVMLVLPRGFGAGTCLQPYR